MLQAGSRSCPKRSFKMADREMIAATLAAGLLAGKNFAGSRVTLEEDAVAIYERVLSALAASAAAQPRSK
jgi:hypothetical protein